MNKVNPFTWGYDEFDRFESIPNQFNATYKKYQTMFLIKLKEKYFSMKILF